MENFISLKEYIDKNKKIPSNRRVDKKLGGFVDRSRQAYKANKLTEEKIRLLESLENWHWGNKLTDWNTRFDELKEYVSKFKEIPTVSDRSELGYWCGRQRSAFRENKLSKERIDLLEGIDGWFWDYKERTRKENFDFVEDMNYWDKNQNYDQKTSEIDNSFMENFISLKEYIDKNKK